MEREYLINNLVAGVYTHRDKYMPRFTANWQNYYPNLPLIYDVQDEKINVNMERLRHRFIESGKRYWLFMDDDILFTQDQVIEIALKSMQKNDLALCSTYQIFSKLALKKKIITKLKYQDVEWVTGHFLLIDSEKIGMLPFDLNLPTKNGDLCDIEYSMKIRSCKHKIGLSPTYVYHEYTKNKGKKDDVGNPIFSKIDISKVDTKKVRKFLDKMAKKYLFCDIDKSIEIQFNRLGKVDENLTIGHAYLKDKYKNIYSQITNFDNNYILSVINE